MTEALGVIASFHQADAVGTIRIDDGREARFGRSACAFEPVVGARVEIVEMTPGFRGAMKATSVRLAEDRATYAGRVGARDAERGASPPTVSAGELAATAREIGALTVLLDDPLPTDLTALMKWALGLDLASHHVDVDVEGGKLVFLAKGVKVRALASHEAYPLAEVDTEELAPAARSHWSAITLLFGFMPHAYYTTNTDSWLPDGSARAISRVAKALVARGSAVIVHRSGERAVPRERFVAMLADLDDPECVPFGAWTKLLVMEGGTALRSVGLRAFGLPEVRVEAPAQPGTWQSARRFEAGLFAVFCLCRRMWIEDGLFEVPRRVQVGPYPPRLIPPVDVERWAAKAEGAGRDLSGNIEPMWLVLRPRPDSDDVSARWASASRPNAGDPSKIGHGGYEALYLHALMTWLHLGQVGMFSELRAVVPYRVITLRGDGPHLVIVSSGMGRAPQPGGAAERGSEHVEILAFSPPANAAVIAEIVGVVAADVHSPKRGEVLEPWGIYATGIAPMLLRPWGPLSMGSGASVTLLELVPLTKEEASAATDPVRRGSLLGPHDRALRDRAHRPRQARPLRGRRLPQAPGLGGPGHARSAHLRLRARRDPV